MRIIALPDLHDSGIKVLDHIAESLKVVDVVLLAGDMTNHTSNIGNIISTIRRYNKTVYAIVGNWDNAYTDQYLTLEGINLHGRHVLLDGIAFIGAGGALPFIFSRFHKVMSEAKFTETLQTASAGLDPDIPKVLLTHEPPKGILDLSGSMGSQSIRDFIEQTQPLICFCGHIHESTGIDTIGSTKVINPGPIMLGHYAYAEIINASVTTLEIRKI